MRQQNHTRVIDVFFEHHLPQEAIGIGEARPRISWRLKDAPAGFTQEKFQIEYYSGNYESGKPPYKLITTLSSESVLVAWPLEDDLTSRDRFALRVRVWGKGDCDPSPWSDIIHVEAGLLHRHDWQCSIISAPWTQDRDVPKPEELYRKTFALPSTSMISRARLYVTAQGVYEVEINGQRVGDHFLTPGWQVYRKRLHYQTYDILDSLLPGTHENCIGIRVAEGWFSGRLGFAGGRRNHSGDRTTVIAQLEVFYDDGSVVRICSDNSWLVAEGPTRQAEIYDGEKYDASVEIDGWSLPPTERIQASSVWSGVASTHLSSLSATLIASPGPPVRRLHVIPVQDILTTAQGKLVLDFGQVVVGYTRMKSVKATKGHIISLSHTEVLENGEPARRPLRFADACDKYTFKGVVEGESWEPRFTFHGFRYVQIEGLPAEVDARTAFEAVVCYSDMTTSGDFSCSDPMVNKLFENARWGMRGNFLDIPTDCPQRDERLGWTGDIALFAPSASFLYDCTGVLQAWLANLVEDQAEGQGVPPLVCPNVIQYHPLASWQASAIWADATILVPWALYWSTGDITILEAQYSSMRSWIEVLPRDVANNRRLYKLDNFQFGDWLDPDAPPDNPAGAKTDALLVANAFLASSLDIIAHVSKRLGKEAEAEVYAKDAAVVRKEFCDEYVTPNGRLVSDSQTAYTLAIRFKMLPTSEQVQRAGDRLSEIVRKNDFRIGTGFAGTPYVCEALALTGHAQVAYRMLLEQKCPSWLYPVTMGATTMWERWDSMLPDGSVNPGEMTSFNHYAFGSVITFLHERLAGLQCVEPGWRRSKVEPILGGGFTEASASHLTPYGQVASSWKIVGNEFQLKVVVPCGTTMEVVLPGSGDGNAIVLTSGEHSFEIPHKEVPGWPPTAIKFTF